jgi:hypothetical protein
LPGKRQPLQQRPESVRMLGQQEGQPHVAEQYVERRMARLRSVQQPLQRVTAKQDPKQRQSQVLLHQRPLVATAPQLFPVIAGGEGGATQQQGRPGFVRHLLTLQLLAHQQQQGTHRGQRNDVAAQPVDPLGRCQQRAQRLRRGTCVDVPALYRQPVPLAFRKLPGPAAHGIHLCRQPSAAVAVHGTGVDLHSQRQQPADQQNRVEKRRKQHHQALAEVELHRFADVGRRPSMEHRSDRILARRDDLVVGRQPGLLRQGTAPAPGQRRLAPPVAPHRAELQLRIQPDVRIEPLQALQECLLIR